MLRWYWVAGGLIAIEFAFAITAAFLVGYSEYPPLFKYGTAATTPVLLYFAYLCIANLKHLPDRPVQHLLTIDWRPLGRLTAAMVLLFLQFSALTWTKGLIPKLTTMWADPMLADLEAHVLGRDAYELLPPPGEFIDAIYSLWFPSLCMTFAVVYLSKWQRRDALLLSFFLIVGILGVFGQYLLPSGGPIFFERLGYGDRFADMNSPDLAGWTSQYLWLAYSGHSVGFATGISAFPSIHVATTTWIAFALRHWFAYIWFTLILFGSISLGWHYALDGIAGIVGAVLCYQLARFLLSASKYRRSDDPLAVVKGKD